jgi:hypothetical protein
MAGAIAIELKGMWGIMTISHWEKLQREYFIRAGK